MVDVDVGGVVVFFCVVSFVSERGVWASGDLLGSVKWRVFRGGGDEWPPGR